MANSRKPKSGSLASRTEAILRGVVRPGDHLAVALSGGVDSIALLDLMAPLSAQMAFSLSAVHVNHGISANAHEWSRFCDELCRAQGIPLRIARVKVRQKPGDSLEAAARDERYRIFSQQNADYIVLAQHLDDQAETLLLQLLRGAGVKGLSGMPAVRSLVPQDTAPALPAGEPVSTAPPAPREGPRLLRPLLEVSRREIEEYAGKRALQWVADESNDDTSFDRNFLRHEVLPLVEKRFPSYRGNFLRASRHIAEASALLDELAQMDSTGCMAAGKLHVEGLRKLSLARGKNFLRYMLAREGAILPSTAKLDEILRQLLSLRHDAKVHIQFGDAEIRCFKGVIHVRHVRGRARASAETDWQVTWNGEKQLGIPELDGNLAFRRREEQKKEKPPKEEEGEEGEESAATNLRETGISLEKLIAQPVSIRPRKGGERLRPDCKRPRRSLKNLLREASLPPWERQSLPLLFSGEHLVCVPGIGVDCEFQAREGEPGLILEWLPRRQ